MEVKTIKKDGSKLIVELIREGADENEKPFVFSFDYVTKVTRNYTGRIVKKFPQKLEQWINQMNGRYFQHLTLRAWRDYMQTNDINIMYKLEKFIPYFDKYSNLITTYALYQLPPECPPKYVEWASENCRAISEQTYEQWLVIKARESWLQQEREVFEFLSSLGIDYCDRIYDKFLVKDNEARAKFTKMIKTSMKTFYISFIDTANRCFRYFWYTDDNDGGKPRPDNWCEYLNPERDIEWNMNNLKSIANKERNSKITEFQQLFKEEIEKLSNDNLTIVVPTQMEEFNEEGKQQNNCVSYYYHNSIADHFNLIYFIRKKNRPNKSYITNRYNFGSGKTTESRAVNNGDYSDKNARELIKEIDKVIADMVYTKHIEVHR